MGKRRTVAVKFLEPGRVAPYTGFKWPRRKWVAVEGPLVPCKNGIHAADREQVRIWAAEGREAWLIELEDVVRTEDKLVARRGRLLRRLASGTYTANDLARWYHGVIQDSQTKADVWVVKPNHPEYGRDSRSKRGCMFAYARTMSVAVSSDDSTADVAAAVRKEAQRRFNGEDDFAPIFAALDEVTSDG